MVAARTVAWAGDTLADDAPVGHAIEMLQDEERSHRGSHKPDAARGLAHGEARREQRMIGARRDIERAHECRIETRHETAFGGSGALSRGGCHPHGLRDPRTKDDRRDLRLKDVVIQLPLKPGVPSCVGDKPVRIESLPTGERGIITRRRRPTVDLCSRPRCRIGGNAIRYRSRQRRPRRVQLQKHTVHGSRRQAEQRELEQRTETGRRPSGCTGIRDPDVSRLKRPAKDARRRPRGLKRQRPRGRLGRSRRANEQNSQYQRTDQHVMSAYHRRTLSYAFRSPCLARHADADYMRSGI